MTKAAAEKRRADQRESVYSRGFAVAFYGSLGGAIAQRSGYLGGSYFIATAIVLSWVVIFFILVAIVAYLTAAGILLKANWSNAIKLDEMSEKIQDVFKNLKVSRMIVLVVIISTLIYINAVLEAVAFSVASSSVAIILVASILIAEHRLKSL